MTAPVTAPAATGTPVSFRRRADRALADERMRAAIGRGTGLMVQRRHEAIAGLANADELRDAAAAIRAAALARLPELLEQWSDNLAAHGGQVHWASDAGEATAIVAGIVARRGAKVIAKGKSMVSEEIHLNDVLERAGADVVETDLGEFIQQLAGEPPSHIVAPAMHKDRFEVADLLAADRGAPVSAEIPAEAAYARERLRQAFLDAGVGITGVNFAVAATGSICLVENEGNGRMCSSLPPTHIALMGLERIVADFDELDVMLNLLARSATGQALTVYTNIITGPRRPGEADGPEELHVVVLDGGRSSVVGTGFSPALHCIRCGACLNVCPVYRQVGGHAYDSVYSGAHRSGADAAAETRRPGGPRAARGLLPVRRLHGDLPRAHPAARPAAAPAPPGRPRRRLATAAGRLLALVAGLVEALGVPGHGAGDPRRAATAAEAPAPARHRLARCLAPHAGVAVSAGTPRHEFLARLRTDAPNGPGEGAPPAPRAEFVSHRSGPEGFMEAWRALGGTAERVPAGGLRAAVAAYTAGRDGPVLAAAGIDADADLRWPDCGPQAAAGAAVGVVRAVAAAAQTGSVFLRADDNKGRAASLLPPACVFVIDAGTVVDTLGDHLRGASDLPSQLVAVTGPSRSADIESTLVIGVHGPGEVHAILTG